MQGLEKFNPKQQGDEQKTDTRCDAFGASRQVTMKPSICKWSVFCKFDAYWMQVGVVKHFVTTPS